MLVKEPSHHVTRLFAVVHARSVPIQFSHLLQSSLPPPSLTRSAHAHYLFISLIIGRFLPMINTRPGSQAGGKGAQEGAAMAIEQVNVGGPPVAAAAPYVDGVALNNSCESSDERGGRDASSRFCKSRPRLSGVPP